MTSYDNIDNSNLKEYVLECFFKFFDLTEERTILLNRILDSFNASDIGVDEFKDHFGLDNFYDVLNFILDKSKIGELKKFGQSFDEESQEKGIGLVKTKPII